MSGVLNVTKTCNWCGEGPYASIRYFEASFRFLKINVDDTIKRFHRVPNTLRSGYYHSMCLSAAAYGFREPYYDDCQKLNSLISDLVNTASYD